MKLLSTNNIERTIVIVLCKVLDYANNWTNTELIIKYFLILIKSSPVDKNKTITAPLKNVKKIVIGNMLYCNLYHFKTFYDISFNDLFYLILCTARWKIRIYWPFFVFRLLLKIKLFEKIRCFILLRFSVGKTLDCFIEKILAVILKRYIL